MENNILMPLNEPTDKQLMALMKEVAAEAKSKSLLTKKKLAEQIAIEISKAKERIKPRG